MNKLSFTGYLCLVVVSVVYALATCFLIHLNGLCVATCYPSMSYIYIYIDFQMENIQWSWTVLVGLTLSASHTWRSSFKKRNYNQDYIQRFIMLAWKYITLAWDYNILVLQKGFLSVFFNDGLLESLLSLTWHQKQCHFL